VAARRDWVDPARSRPLVVDVGDVVPVPLGSAPFAVAGAPFAGVPDAPGRVGSDGAVVAPGPAGVSAGAGPGAAITGGGGSVAGGAQLATEQKGTNPGAPPVP
jgi:hypothetical protein